jgi:acetyl-CoA acetyltransferase
MSFLKTKTPEDVAALEADKAAALADRAASQAAVQMNQRGMHFDQTLAGQARTAYQKGFQVFQCQLDASSRTVVDDINAVCREGWDLVTTGFVFIESGQQSRDKLMKAGQYVSTRGSTMGYYVFKRAVAAA